MSTIQANHPVFIASEPNQELLDFILAQKTLKVGVLVDENSLRHCYPLVLPFLPKDHVLIQISSGEENKTLETCTQIWKALTEHAFERSSLLINFGGGVIGDMGGFCAATYKRGIKFVQIPTTLLSQVDASVGGKLGIDFEGFKNHIGVFKEPEAVFVFPCFLNTLLKKEIRSGFAEMIKHALIADASQWQKVKKIGLNDLYHLQFEPEKTIPLSIAIKAKVVQEDPLEKGLRKILNFGHTLGHAVETFYLPTPQKLLHGEAIAIGMIAESYLAFKYGFIQREHLEEITLYLTSIYGVFAFPASQILDIIALTLQDKKNAQGQVKMALIDGIGSCKYDVVVTTQDMDDALMYYLALA